MANRRILIIDDDIEIWKAYQKVLAPEDEELFASNSKISQLLESEKDTSPKTSSAFRLRFAHQGQEGYGLVQEALSERMPYAVAFIDIRMPPGWDGMETAQKIRNIDPDIEIVIVTAYSDRSREEIAEQIGRSDKLLFLRKPFEADEIHQIALSLSEKWTIERHEEAQRQDLETILNTSPIAIFTVNSNCQITSWNPMAEEITGYPASEVIGKPCTIGSISDNQCADCPIKNEDRSNRSFMSNEFTIRDKNGQKKIILKRVSFIRDNKDHIVKSVETFWDITKRKEAESALQNSELRFRSLVETSSDWVWEMDNNGVFTYCSPLCEQIYGYLPEELLGREIYETLLPPDDAQQFQLIVEQSIRDKVGFNNIERRSLTKDGKIIYIETSGAPIISMNETLTGYRGVDRDITERVKSEKEKIILEEQFRQSQKMEVLGTLAGGIAHDFNNILTPILLNTQISMMGLEKDSKLYKNLLDINKSAENASALIRQILSFSRKQVLLHRALNLNEIISDFAKMLRRLIREDIDLQLDLEEDLWPIIADSSQVEQILINLVVNARDAIISNGKITITTQNQNIHDTNSLDIDKNVISGSYVVLSVKDTGIGIDSKKIDQVFAPFYTTKGNGAGTGLGLSLVHGIVNQYNGHIKLDTRKNKGATFSVYFKQSTQKVDITEEEPLNDVTGGDETILIAEDNIEVRVVITTILKRFGYNIIEALNGTDAFDKYNDLKGKMDLLLTDVVMPGMGGEILAQKIHADNPNMPVIFMSGHPFDPSQLESVDDKTISYIQKPFYPKNIAHKIREVLDNTVKQKQENSEV